MNWGMVAAGLGLGFVLGLLVPGFVLEDGTEAVFSPEEGSRIISFIDSAKESVDIEVYLLTSRDVVDALERAKRRGVRVRIILEKELIGTDNDEIFAELLSKGFDVRFASGSFQLTHSKFIIIDGKAVLVGSHNLSNSALFKNREASVIIRDQGAVSDFVGIFEHDWSVSSFG